MCILYAHCQSLLLVPCDASLPKFVVVKEDIHGGPIILRRIRWKVVVESLTVLVVHYHTRYAAATRTVKQRWLLVKG